MTLDSSPTNQIVQVPGLHIASTPNFRDFGGAPLPDGRRVVSGRLFRSEHLSGLNGNELAVVGELGIALVCDLRSRGERERHPDRWPAGRTYESLALDVNADVRAGDASLRELIATDPSPRGAREVMLQVYRMLPASSAAALAVLFQRLDAGVGPVLIHCTAGKDRTGFVCAALLSALGVPADAVMADYLLSRERIDLKALAATTAEIFRGILGMDLPPESMGVVNTVDPEYLDAAFTSAAAQFGSFDVYLESVGATRELRDRLKERLLR